MGLFDTEDQAKLANIIVRGKLRASMESTKSKIKKEVKTVKQVTREAMVM